MAEAETLDEGLKKFSKKIFPYFERISNLSLKEKISELEQLQEKKRTLEEEVEFTTTQIAVLQHSPDVSEYQVINDDTARILLSELQETGDILYADLVESYDEISKMITFNYLTRLRMAGFVEFDIHPSDSKKDRVMLTEKGRNFQYVEEA